MLWSRRRVGKNYNCNPNFFCEHESKSSIPQMSKRYFSFEEWILYQRKKIRAAKKIKSHQLMTSWKVVTSFEKMTSYEVKTSSKAGVSHTRSARCYCAQKTTKSLILIKFSLFRGLFLEIAETKSFFLLNCGPQSTFFGKMWPSNKFGLKTPKLKSKNFGLILTNTFTIEFIRR